MNDNLVLVSLEICIGPNPNVSNAIKTAFFLKSKDCVTVYSFYLELSFVFVFMLTLCQLTVIDRTQIVLTKVIVAT